jgi:hypothetical protein
MSDLSNNPLVNQRVAAALRRLGVSIEIDEDKKVTARLPERVEFAASSKIFLKLAELGVRDYDASTLNISTCSGTVVVKFTLS